MKPLQVRWVPRLEESSGANGLVFIGGDGARTGKSDHQFAMMKAMVDSGKEDSVLLVGMSVATGWRIHVEREVHFQASNLYNSPFEYGVAERQAAQRIVPIMGWVHIVSPLNTIQELVDRDLHYPWRVLVVCQLLNQTHGRQVRPMIDEFFQKWPYPGHFLKADLSELITILRPLGLFNRRANSLMRMTQDYLAKKRWQECYGTGPYALDSLSLYVRGSTDVKPTDTWLEPYLKWRLAGGPRVGWDWDGHRAWRGEVMA